jgi:hypothetical protein
LTVFTARLDDLPLPIVEVLTGEVEYRLYDGIVFNFKIEDTTVANPVELWVKVVSQNLSFSKVFVLDGVNNILDPTAEGLAANGTQMIFQLPAGAEADDDLQTRANHLQQNEKYWLAVKWFDAIGNSSDYTELQSAHFTSRALPVRNENRVTGIDDAAKIGIETDGTLTGIKTKITYPGDVIKFNRDPYLTAIYFTRAQPTFSDEVGSNAYFVNTISNFDEATDQILLRDDFDIVSGDISDPVIEYDYTTAAESSQASLTSDQTFYITAVCDGRFGDSKLVTIPANFRFVKPTITAATYQYLDGTHAALGNSDGSVSSRKPTHPVFSCTVVQGSRLFGACPVVVRNKASGGNAGGVLTILSYSTLASGQIFVEVETTRDADLEFYAVDVVGNESTDAIELAYLYQSLEAPTVDVQAVSQREVDSVIETISTARFNFGDVDGLGLGDRTTIIKLKQTDELDTSLSITPEDGTAAKTGYIPTVLRNTNKRFYYSQQTTMPDRNNTELTAKSSVTESEVFKVPCFLTSVVYTGYAANPTPSANTAVNEALFTATVSTVGSEPTFHEILFVNNAGTQVTTTNDAPTFANGGTISVRLPTSDSDNYSAVNRLFAYVNTKTEASVLDSAEEANHVQVKNHDNTSAYKAQNRPTRSSTISNYYQTGNVFRWLYNKDSFGNGTDNETLYAINYTALGVGSRNLFVSSGTTDLSTDITFEGGTYNTKVEYIIAALQNAVTLLLQSNSTDLNKPADSIYSLIQETTPFDILQKLTTPRITYIPRDPTPEVPYVTLLFNMTEETYLSETVDQTIVLTIGSVVHEIPASGLENYVTFSRTATDFIPSAISDFVTGDNHTNIVIPALDWGFSPDITVKATCEEPILDSSEETTVPVPYKAMVLTVTSSVVGTRKINTVSTELYGSFFQELKFLSITKNTINDLGASYLAVTEGANTPAAHTVAMNNWFTNIRSTTANDWILAFAVTASTATTFTFTIETTNLNGDSTQLFTGFSLGRNSNLGSTFFGIEGGTGN